MLNRRDAMIGLGQAGLGTLALPGLLQSRAGAAGRATAKNCILVFLWGGPPQQDMWDLKPDAPEGIRSPFKPIKTSAAGVEVGDQMPRIAKVMDRCTVIRSVTHGSDVHEVGVYLMLTGQLDGTMVVPRNNRDRRHFPGPASILSCLRPSKGGVPSAVTLPRPVMHDGVKYSGTHGGWMGARYDPLEMPDSAFHEGRPVWDFGAGGGPDVARLARRRGLLSAIESADRRMQESPAAQAMDAFQERAFGLLTSADAKAAFNLDAETPATRDRYGRNHYGEAFLLSRRLIEAGTRMVTLNWMFFRPDGNPLNPWDNHGGTPALGGVSGYEMLKRDYCLPPLDLGLSALIEDLDTRGLLDETLVVVMGEFGRTPKINSTGGRDHWGACQSVVLAGGGVKRGFIYGASDAHAAFPTEDPVRPEDLLATMYHAFGLSPDAEVFDRENRPHPISRGVPVRALFG